MSRAPSGVLAALALVVAAGIASASACKLPKALAGGAEMEKSGVRLMWRVTTGPIKVGKPFTIAAAACRRSGAAVTRLRVDADMPAHGHGMNYRPAEKKLGPGWSRFEGFVFHMPGEWRLIFDIAGPAGAVRLTTKVDVSQ